MKRSLLVLACKTRYYLFLIWSCNVRHSFTTPRFNQIRKTRNTVKVSRLEEPVLGTFSASRPPIPPAAAIARWLSHLMARVYMMSQPLYHKHISYRDFETFEMDQMHRPNGEDDDVLFKDTDVCVLRPDSSRGILICHRYDLDDEVSVHRDGLVPRGGSYPPVVYFRAPFHWPPNGVRDLDEGMQSLSLGKRRWNDEYVSGTKARRTITPNGGDCASRMAETSCYDEAYLNPAHGHFFIRIDPACTFVYSSEARVRALNVQGVGPRRLLVEYLKIVEENRELRKPAEGVFTPLWHLYSFRKRWSPAPVSNPRNMSWDDLSSPWSHVPIERDCEVRVRIPSVPPAWRCEWAAIGESI